MTKYELKIPFFLLWCHLKRGNKWTLSLIIFLMSIAFINLIFVSSLFAGIIKSADEQVINTYAGHIMLLPQDGADYFENAEEIIDKINPVEDVAGVSSQISVPGNIKYKNTKGNWPILAIDPDQEKKVTNVSQMMQEGEYLNVDDLDQIVIGRQMAGGDNVAMKALSLIDAKVGDTITINVGGLSKDFKIKGIFYTKFLETDKRAFITKKAYAEMFLGQDAKATTITIKNKKTGEEDTVIKKLEDSGIDGKFYTWKEMAGMMQAVTESFFSINFIMSVVAILIAAFTVFIVIYIDVSTKRQQVGILRAIGIRPYLIVSAYILQTVFYSLAGVAVGTGLFFGIIVVYFQYHPFVLPIGDAHLLIDYKDFIIRLEFFIWISIFAGIVPAALVVRTKILDAIWGDK